MWLRTCLRDNLVRFNPKRAGKGHMESFFMKLNDPTADRALWIKFTILSPRKKPDAAVAQVWAIWFGDDGERIVVRETYPASCCELSTEGRVRLKLGASHFEEDQTVGTVETANDCIGWDLAYDSNTPSLRLLPHPWMYTAPFPRSKLVTPNPNLAVRGYLRINGRRYEVQDWPAMQGHNWGTAHPLIYAWWHCNGFGHPDTFIEGVASNVKIGPFKTGLMTLVHLRFKGKDLVFNGLRQARSVNTCRIGDYFAAFEAEGDGWKLVGRVEAEKDRLVALPYNDPHGGLLRCLNSKLASFKIDLHKDGSHVATLECSRKGALELGLRDGSDHGVPFVIPSDISWKLPDEPAGGDGPAVPIEAVSGRYRAAVTATP